MSDAICDSSVGHSLRIPILPGQRRRINPTSPSGSVRAMRQPQTVHLANILENGFQLRVGGITKGHWTGLSSDFLSSVSFAW